MKPIPSHALPRASRRHFLQATALAGGGLVIAFVVPGAGRFAWAQQGAAPESAPQGEPPKAAPPPPNAFLRIAPDGSVTVLLAHSEMGQGIWTTLPLLLNEELDADWTKIRVEHAPNAPVYSHTYFGAQMTGGSSSTWSEFERYRQVGAMARAMLVAAAAERFGVAADACRTENGFVIAGEKRAAYGELAEAAARREAPATVALRPASDWRQLGKPTKRLDTPEKITGKAIFGYDVQLPGLKTALVARAPTFGARLKSVDATKARQVAGVRDVVEVPSGVAVIADHFWAARQGRDALVLAWEAGPGEPLESANLLRQYAALAKTDGPVAAKAGDVDAGLAKAARVHEASFDFPYLAHAAMEPLNCTVRLADGACEIWTGTQFQSPDSMAAAQAAGVDPSKVTIHTTFLGGGFGRRATPTSDFVVEAVQVAKAAKVPVKVLWTREDDTRGGYYRPMCHHRAQVGVDAQGNPVAWKHAIVGQSIVVGTPFAAMIKDGIDPTSTEGCADSPYVKGVPDHRVTLHSPTSAVPVLWWRSVGHTHTAFAMESLVDELAAAAKQDPLAYRRRLLAGHPRHLGVLNLAADKAGWGSELPKGRARGIAVHESFGSYVAQVAEVSVEGGNLRVHRVVCAVDCGVVANPAGVVAQMESGIAYGLSAALYGAITFKDGKVEQSNFHDYRVLRLPEMPRVEVHIVASTEKPGGAGEPGTPPIAPAVANAVFALNGRRLRELPLRLEA